MRVQVLRVSIPAWSTIGYGEGLTEDERRVHFMGDHRPMRELGRALPHAQEPVYAEVESWQLVEGR
jgi:hypothetical protein